MPTDLPQNRGVPSTQGPMLAPGVARLLDAAANRSREAARTLEDVARFVLNDEALLRQCKELRHDLTGLLAGVGVGVAERGLASRSTARDVGTGISTAAEGQRAGLGAVVEAAGGRLAEGLRSIEEGLKAAGRGMAAQEAERLRYRGYDVARAVRMALGTGRGQGWVLCVLITEAVCRRGWEEVARRAIAGGADCLQLREKGLEDRELLARARRLVEIARAAGAQLGAMNTGSRQAANLPHSSPRDRRVAVVINDRPDIALLAGADGVHLGQTDLTVADVRRLAGFDLLVGVSCSTLAQAQQAAREGADYLGLGPMFPSGTKPKEQLAGPELVQQVVADAACARLPHLAISGITAENAGELARAGCRGVAVSAAVCGAADPAEAARAIVRALGAGQQDTQAVQDA